MPHVHLMAAQQRTVQLYVYHDLLRTAVTCTAVCKCIVCSNFYVLVPQLTVQLRELYGVE